MENFIDVWRSLNAIEKIELADRLETKTSYLSQIAHGHRSPGKHFKIALERDLESQRLKNLVA